MATVKVKKSKKTPLWQAKNVRKSVKLPTARMVAEGERAEIFIYDAIGDWFFGITASSFMRGLRDLGDVKTIDVRINSPGGVAWDGLTIYNALVRHQAKVIVHVDGLAASAAAIIAMAGDEIHMAQNAMMMVHEAWGGAVGRAVDLRREAGVLEGINGSQSKIFADRTGISEEEIASLLEAETWFTADEAVERGFATHVTANKSAAAAHFDLSGFRRVPKAARVMFGRPATQPTVSPEGGAMSATTTTEKTHTENQPPAGGAQPTPPAEPKATLTDAEREALRAEAAAAENKRVTEIMSAIAKAPLPEEQKAKLQKELCEDQNATIHDAHKALFDAMCRANKPVGDDGAGDVDANADPDKQFKQEYAAAREIYEAEGISLEDYIASRKLDAAA